MAVKYRMHPYIMIDINQIKGPFDKAFITIMSMVLSLAFLEPVLRMLNLPALADTVHNVLHLFCHQIPDRCFQINGFPTGICGRCIALHIALLVTRYIAGIIIKYGKSQDGCSRTRYLNPVIPIILVLQMPAEWFLGVLGLTQSTLLSRSLSGLMFGTGWILGPHIWLNTLMSDLLKKCRNAMSRDQA